MNEKIDLIGYACLSDMTVAMTNIIENRIMKLLSVLVLFLCGSCVSSLDEAFLNIKKQLQVLDPSDIADYNRIALKAAECFPHTEKGLQYLREKSASASGRGQVSTFNN
jgi:hypothetical protein